MKSLTAADQQTTALILKQYKTQTGVVRFDKIFDIPKSERIMALSERDMTQTTMLVIASLTKAFESINFKRGVNELQVLTIADVIIESAGEDNLCMEDLLLFLQKMVKGDYEMSFDQIDVPRFMKLFNQYRDERWSEGVRIRDEKNVQLQSIGDANRSAKADPLSEHMRNLSGRLSEMKEAMSERKQSETMKKADKYFDGK